MTISRNSINLTPAITPNDNNRQYCIKINGQAYADALTTEELNDILIL